MSGSCGGARHVHQSSSKCGASQDSARNGEEAKGLLDVHGADSIIKEARSHDYYHTLPAFCCTRVKWIVMGLIGLLVYIRTLFSSPSLHPNQTFVGEKLRSNGTHDFKRTVVLISIDGFRADYLDRGLTPHLLDISKQGIRAKFMRPIFPTLTFPNHWTLITGLYAESHGIVANNFWDPASRSEFHYSNVKSWRNASWWFGEPVWETARRAGLITANLMWLGPTKTSSGVETTYFVPWQDGVPLNEKLDQIISWVDLPLHKRPQLILAYDQSLDHAGHTTGPMSSAVNRTLQQIDSFARVLHAELQARNLTDIVDTIFVSDHGMTDTSHPEFIYMDDILGAEGVKMIEHEDGWPSMGLRFRPEANETHYLQTLIQASEANGHKFDVYTHETMPKRYHFSDSDRIAPIYVVPKIGYALTTYEQGTAGMSAGAWLSGLPSTDAGKRHLCRTQGMFNTNFHIKQPAPIKQGTATQTDLRSILIPLIPHQRAALDCIPSHSLRFEIPILKMRFFVAIALFASFTAVLAEQFTVIVGKDNGLTYDPPFVTAKNGDVVAFQFVSKNHTVTQSTFANPCQRMTTPALGVDSGYMPVAAGATAFPQWSITINNASNPLWFYCAQQPHCTRGMVFAINPTADKTFDQFKAAATGSAATGSAATGSAATGSATSAGTSPSASAPAGNGASSIDRSAASVLACITLALAMFL
ncbi:hypothetical protein EYR40_009626 [Pleurotus pulmonarius]|nr:hypothetical protein EYR40_009626 [Pleurotus pulmonarius]